MDIQQLFADRIGGAMFGETHAVYKFQKIKNAKQEARQNHPGVELLDFGVGEPDRIAPAPIREALKTAVDDPANRGYADNGIEAFKTAAGEYMAKFFNVTDLDPATEINHSIGSKPALVIRGADGEFRAFIAVCTHLDCTVQYVPEESFIWCACHNGKYDLNGINVSGPPPRPLTPLAVNVQQGVVLISKEA